MSQYNLLGNLLFLVSIAFCGIAVFVLVNRYYEQTFFMMIDAILFSLSGYFVKHNLSQAASA